MLSQISLGSVTASQTAVAVIAVSFVSFVSSGVLKRVRRTPPGPIPLPIVGNWFDFPNKDPWITFAEWSEHYGECCNGIVHSPGILIPVVHRRRK